MPFVVGVMSLFVMAELETLFLLVVVKIVKKVNYLIVDSCDLNCKEIVVVVVYVHSCCDLNLVEICLLLAVECECLSVAVGCSFLVV